jgi:hypothetical protein
VVPDVRGTQETLGGVTKGGLQLDERIGRPARECQVTCTLVELPQGLGGVSIGACALVQELAYDTVPIAKDPTVQRQRSEPDSVTLRAEAPYRRVEVGHVRLSGADDGDSRELEPGAQ